MMTFCKKSVHSLLAYVNNSKDNTTVDSSGHRNIPSVLGGLGFISFSGDIQKPTNVVESTTVKSSPPPLPQPFTAAAGKRDRDGIGFLDDVGGSIDGLMSCTESLGFESSDERRVKDQIEDLNNNGFMLKPKFTRSRLKKTVVMREKKKFPPPLSSLNQDGKQTFFLRSVRKDGRLELTEFKIDRPKILRASRQDGRLILHLIRDADVDVHEEADEEFQEYVEEKEGFQENFEEVEKEEERGGEWWLPAVSGGGDGFRRCHDLVNRPHYHHHHNNLHTWSQHCVTIR